MHCLLAIRSLRVHTHGLIVKDGVDGLVDGHGAVHRSAPAWRRLRDATRSWSVICLVSCWAMDFFAAISCPRLRVSKAFSTSRNGASWDSFVAAPRLLAVGPSFVPPMSMVVISLSPSFGWCELGLA
ncbi:hypothetical protein ACFFX0_23405 [Citricoccus parietis]|uniref:Uncharacterized protein n=1 Tax=Citricoccus parietis TaxID=592307 RepID=A0ABV5G6D8_9MICC